MRGSSRSPPHRERSGPRPSPLPCRTHPGRPESGRAPFPVPKTLRAPAHRRAACRRTRTCTAPPGRAAGRTRAAAAPPARRRAGAPHAVRARSGWFEACGYIYLWPDSHGSRWMSIRLLALIPVAAAISLALSAAVDAVALPPVGACFFGSFVSDFGDKAVTFALVTSVLRALPRRTAARFPWALRAIGAA